MLSGVQAQRTAREQPSNILRLDDRDAVSWVEPVRDDGDGQVLRDVRNKNVRQL